MREVLRKELLSAGFSTPAPDKLKTCTFILAFVATFPLFLLAHMPTLVLNPTNLTDFQLLLSLAHRLGVEVTQPPSSDPAQLEARFFALAGSWQSNDTGDELNAQLQAARVSNRDDITL